jgi:hypothetical protein
MNLSQDAMNQLEEQDGLKKRSYRSQAQPDQIQFNIQEDNMSETAPMPRMSNQTPPQMQEDYYDEGDRPIFPGGPYESQILSWKKQYGDIYLGTIGDEEFIFRALTRFEYKQIVSAPDTDPLMREEFICEVCTLWPAEMTWQDMAERKAGIPARLSEQILDKSAFTQNVTVRAL